MFLRCVPAAICAGFLLMATGCGGTAIGTVSGTVKGPTIKRGLITFLPEKGAKDVYPAAIIEGKYESVDVPVGWCKVIITPGMEKPAPEPKQNEGVDTSPPPKAGTQPSQANQVPEKYQTVETTPLRVEIKPGPNVYDPDLTQ